MATGMSPQDAPAGSLSKCKPSKPLGFIAALAELKGDWKMMSEVVGLPAWNCKAGMCWRCNIINDDSDQVDEHAPWRRPENRLSHGDLLLQLQAKGPLCKVFDIPGFHSKLFRIDWLHCADLGITANMWGAILHICVGMPKYGSNQQQRLDVIWADMLGWYDTTGVRTDRLKRLPLKRFKHKKARPCLKASAGQIRALVPWFLRQVRSWSLEDFVPKLHEEVLRVQSGTEHLAICYQCLSKESGFDDPLAVLKRHSILYAQDLVALEALDDDRHSVPPKLHMWLELCSEGCTPSKSWNYRDEDFGGSMANMARRRGGRETGLAVSRNTLQAFCVKQPLPILKGLSPQGSASTTSVQPKPHVNE